VENFQEACLVRGQVSPREGLEQVAKVVGRVESEPFDILIEHKARHHEHLTKVLDINTLPLKTIKIYS